MFSIFEFIHKDTNIIDIICDLIYLYKIRFKIVFNDVYILAQVMKLHHAGWDAYYTGYCFVKIIQIMKVFSGHR